MVIELKTGEFKPEYAGQLNFYLSAVDGTLKRDGDNPSIGTYRKVRITWLQNTHRKISRRMGVSEYRITSHLPEELKEQLPSIEDSSKANSVNWRNTDG